jgi:beta-ribofuranosylaminobenzene 5'-phosphate synthase
VTTAVRVETGSRLHFGLLDLTGDLGRVDGSLGVSLSEPRLVIKVSESDIVEADMYQDLVQEAVAKLNSHYDLELGLKVKVVEHFPRHVGLGCATQVLLAIATSYMEIQGIRPDTRHIASVLGRGGTSGVGTATFEMGGLVLDAGHAFGQQKGKHDFLPSRASSSPPAPVIFRSDLPSTWVFDVLIPQGARGLSGQSEVDFFTSNCPIDAKETRQIAHIVLSTILPATLERNITTFIRGINLLTTLGFKRKEIDTQNSNIKQTYENLKNITQEHAALGLSSFGPTIFMISSLETRRDHLMEAVSSMEDLAVQESSYHYVAHCRNQGALVDLLT